MEELLRRLTSTWLFGTMGQHEQLAVIEKWCASMKRAFHGEYLEELKKRPGDYGRVAFLRLIDLTLFDEVKKAIVADKSGTIEGAIRVITQAR